MPEDLAGLDAITAPALDASVDTPAESPATDSVPDIEKVRTQYEERIKGFQRLVSEREQELVRLREQEERARISALPDDERTAYERSRAEEELSRLRTENEVLRMGSKYQSVYDKYEALMRAKTVEEQFQLLDGWLKPPAPSADADETEAHEKPAPVDKNNPVKQKATMVGDYQMDETIAKRLLSSIQNWPRG
jgi:hypothetical protein